MIIKKNIKLAISLALSIPPVFYAQAEENIEYSPYAKRHYPTEVYFGDTHHHTANSGDAFMNGDRLSPESAENKRDGLYWETSVNEQQSPLGPLFAETTPDGAYYGYYYRILTSQGANAKGGALSYLRDNQMTGGFALIAWPAEYGNTGVMSFIVNQDGIVYQQNLGPDTAELATQLPGFDPASV